MKQVADYKILHQLGEGGQGQFWMAETPARLNIPDNSVALKTVNHVSNEEDFRRLTRQMRRYAAIKSDNLVQLYDVGQQGTIVYLAGEYLSGGSLAKPAKPASRIDLLKALAAASFGAHHLHEAGITHRSIRPGNVILSETAAKLGEIGVTQILCPGQTVTGTTPVHTVEYLAPETIQGQTASRSSDIWALGATLHQVLTGVGVYPDLSTSSLVAALRYILNTRPVMGDALRNGERKIIEICVATDPAERYATAKELGDALTEEARRQEKRLAQ